MRIICVLLFLDGFGVAASFLLSNDVWLALLWVAPALIYCLIGRPDSTFAPINGELQRLEESYASTFARRVLNFGCFFGIAIICINVQIGLQWWLNAIIALSVWFVSLFCIAFACTYGLHPEESFVDNLDEPSSGLD